MPPSKVYETLQRLQAKGAVLVYHSEPVRYAAVPYHTVLDGLRRRFTADMEFAETNLGALPVSHDPGLTWSLQQRASILSTCVQAIQSAQRVIYAALWDAELGELGAPLEAASQRGVEVHVAIYGSAVLQGPHSYDLSLCGQSAIERLNGRRLSVLVVDEREAVVAEFRPNQVDEAIMTTHPIMSLLAVEYIKSDVMGRVLINALGEEPYQRLRREHPDFAAMLTPVPLDP